MINSKISPVKIAGLNVMPFSSMAELLTHVFDSNGKIVPGMAVAVNPEKVLKSIEDDETKTIINNASIAYADGIGVVKTLERKTGKKLTKIAGVELWLAILKQSKSFNSKVLLIGATPKVIAETNDILCDEGINIVNYIDGYFDDISIPLSKVTQYQPDIVIVAQGSPRQEKLIQKLRDIHPNAFYMGVGGSFDVLSGNVQRAPEAWVKYNVEWLYRLLSDPKRIGRQLKLLKYVYLYMFNKL